MYVVNVLMFLIVYEFVCAFPESSNAKMNGFNDSIVHDNQDLKPHQRVKRQQPGGGAAKYEDAAKVPQIKALRLFLQLIKNMWASAYLGGSHPLHPNVPKTFVELYQEKVEKALFPPAGGDPEKQPQT